MILGGFYVNWFVCIVCIYFMYFFLFILNIYDYDKINFLFCRVFGTRTDTRFVDKEFFYC